MKNAAYNTVEVNIKCMAEKKEAAFIQGQISMAYTLDAITRDQKFELDGLLDQKLGEIYAGSHPNSTDFTDFLK